MNKRTLKLSDIISSLKSLQVFGPTNGSVNNIIFDSRQVLPGALFVATKGTQSDAHQYIDQCIEKGANAIICEDLPKNLNSKICYIQVENSSKSLGLLASLYYDFPSSNLKLVGVTGTNGKTTIATLLYHLFEQLGYKTGLLSTVENFIHKTVIKATHTTPDAVQINKLMAEMVAEGCEYCFMEVSSHAIAQHRIEGLDFNGAIFTNITHDHLDYHKTFKAYIKAKKMFFDFLPKTAFAITNKDDNNGLVMTQNCKAKVKTYAVNSMADYKSKTIEKHFEGTLIHFNQHELWTNLIGDFNVYNLTAIIATALELNQNIEEILPAVSQLQSVNGRFESIKGDSGVTAIVDYAHTPDALLNVLNTINKLKTNGQDVITVVGAGGDRDKTKRPEMAQIACKHSTKVILTSDNPRTENPEQILNDMEAGLDAIDRKKMLRISDRKQAINTACMLAQAKDIILVAGKGHETYQDINGVKHHFDDKEIIREQIIQNKKQQ